MIFRTTGAVLCIAVLVLIAGCGEHAAPPQSGDDSVAVNEKYHKDATILSLCFLSNIASGYIDSAKFNPVSDLQHKADSMMTKVLTDSAAVNRIGNWQMVWGPCIYSDPLADSYTAADLTMVLLKGKDPEDTAKTMYVLSIAGTNSVSVYDWLYADLNVDSMFLWPAPPAPGNNNLAAFADASEGSASVTDTNITNSGNYISIGMALGMKDLLLTMANNNGTGKTLIDYLKANITSATPVELAVTGHSMGGALSPCVALALKDNQSYWDASNMFTVTAYPFAGPSPGNKNFADYFMKTIGAENFHGRYNTNDVAPRVFNSTSMLGISTMYNSVPGFPPGQCLAAGIFSCAAQQLNGFHYTSLYSSFNGFTGGDSLPAGADTAFANAYNRMTPSAQKDVNGFIAEFSQCTSIPPDSVLAGFGCFGSMVIQQHFDAYRNHFHCETVFDLIQQSQGPGPGAKKGEVLLGRIVEETLIGNCR